jgi:hypothetical protein
MGTSGLNAKRSPFERRRYCVSDSHPETSGPNDRAVVVVVDEEAGKVSTWV